MQLHGTGDTKTLAAGREATEEAISVAENLDDLLPESVRMGFPYWRKFGLPGFNERLADALDEIAEGLEQHGSTMVVKR